jgi:hypothetical protein
MFWPCVGRFLTGHCALILMIKPKSRVESCRGRVGRGTIIAERGVEAFAVRLESSDNLVSLLSFSF